MNLLNKDLRNRLFLVVTGIIGMGISVSFLIEVNYGTDTSTFMNLSLANRIGITFGLCLICVNILFFIPQVIFGRKLINIGTILNMFFIGIISDFCRNIWAHIIPRDIFVLQPYRTIVFIIALIAFLIFVAFYINSDLGQAPYDAIPAIISKSFKFSYQVVRIIWDFTAICVGLLVGGKVPIGTVIMALTLGPMVSFIGRLLKRTPKKKVIYEKVRKTQIR